MGSWTRLNERFAVHFVAMLATMECFYFGVVFSLLPFVNHQWQDNILYISNVFQLCFLPIILVAQAVIERRQRQQSEEDHAALVEILTDAREQRETTSHNDRRGPRLDGKKPMMRLVVVESPFAGNGRWPLNVIRRWQNIHYARRCVRNSVLRGEAPIASHLLFTQRGILRDSNPEERQKGIDAGHAWLREADYMVVYIDRGISRGMREGIKRATSKHMPIWYRSLKDDSSHPGSPTPP